MAQIILEPGEVFGHEHDIETTTELVSGVAELRLDGKTIELKQNTEVTIPAHTPHLMVNAGNEEAILYCEYNCRRLD